MLDMKCVEPSCERKARSKGMCTAHYVQVWSGKELTPLRPKASDGSDDITYIAAHKRVERAKGKATEHDCLGCGEQAEQWAYRHGSPKERTESTPGYKIMKRYSPDVNDYMPLCVSCHIKYDRWGKVPA